MATVNTSPPGKQCTKWALPREKASVYPGVCFFFSWGSVGLDPALLPAPPPTLFVFFSSALVTRQAKWPQCRQQEIKIFHSKARKQTLQVQVVLHMHSYGSKSVGGATPLALSLKMKRNRAHSLLNCYEYKRAFSGNARSRALRVIVSPIFSLPCV
jgi:hypothetical protein